MPTEDPVVPSPANTPLSGLPALLGRIEAEARRVSETLWSAEDDARLEAAYEQAAVVALRAPLLAERSIALRRIAKRAVPKALVPAARRAVGIVDGVSRRVVRARVKRRGSS
jgi:hypothetical protein